MKKLGAVLKNARQLRGLSLRDASRLTAIPVPVVRKLEEGEFADPPVLPLCHLASVFGIERNDELRRRFVEAVTNPDSPISPHVNTNPKPATPAPIIAPAKGVRFLHARILDEQALPERKPMLCEITKVQQGTVYYAHVEPDGTRARKAFESCTVERWPFVCREVVPQ